MKDQVFGLRDEVKVANGRAAEAERRAAEKDVTIKQVGNVRHNCSLQHSPRSVVYCWNSNPDLHDRHPKITFSPSDTYQIHDFLCHPSWTSGSLRSS